MSIDQHMENLRKKENKAQAELDFIAELRQEFPDLETTTDRWGKVRYMAKSVNARVNEVLIHSNCGCCPDSPVHARPYLKLNNGTYIYSNPCNVMIGNPYAYGGGFREYENWEEKYVEVGVNPQVIEEIKHYIERRIEEEDDDEWD